MVFRSDHPRRIYGVDFSGAAQAGKRIWITDAVVEGELLHIKACYAAADLPGSGYGRDRCLAALRSFIGESKASIFGLDFPFGLPSALVKQESWLDFVCSFPSLYRDPVMFRSVCRAASNGSELKRVTDRESLTPFSPYNIRLYRQTYFGIRDILVPLVQDGLVCVLPMQPTAPGKPWLIEICPASTLKAERLYWPYKGKSEKYHRGRTLILEELAARAPLSISTRLRSIILDEPGGDALDSLVAAFAAYRVLRNPDSPWIPSTDAYALEGYVYI